MKKKKVAVIVPEISHCAIFGCCFSMSCLIYPDSMRSFDVNSSNHCMIFVIMHYFHVVHPNLITEVEPVGKPHLLCLLGLSHMIQFPTRKDCILECTAVLVFETLVGS